MCSEFFCVAATLINFLRIKFVSVVADVWLKEMSLWEVMESPPASKLVSEAEAVERTEFVLASSLLASAGVQGTVFFCEDLNSRVC